MNPFSCRFSLRFHGVNFDPEEITKGIQLIPEHSWKTGDKIKTPKGTILSGIRKSSYWFHRFTRSEDLSVEDSLTSILTFLLPKKDFLRAARSSGIDIELFIGIFCSRNIGFTLNYEHARLLSDLMIDAGFDIYPEDDQNNAEQADAPNSHAFGTFVTHPADAGCAPKASGHG